MGTEDEARNVGEQLRGKAKEAVGHATADEELKARGKGDQVEADVKQAGEKIKDAFKGSK